MTRLEKVAAVWENPEGAYQRHLKEGGKLTRNEFVRKIAFIKDEKFNSGLLYGVLGAEVASYNAEDHEEMNTLKNVITSVASYLLTGGANVGDDLTQIVAVALRNTILSEVSEESQFSFEDCYLLKNSASSCDLNKIVESGFFDTAVFYDREDKLQVFPMEMQYNNYFYAADIRDLTIFRALYEAGLITRSDFLDRVFTYLNAKLDEIKNDRGFAFVDSSLITQQIDAIHFAGKEFKLDECTYNEIADIKFVETEIQGTFQAEHIIFCGV